MAFVSSARGGGTDAPNPGTTFGASMHEELALLVAAGLSPTAALTAATSAPATRFALADRGRIASQGALEITGEVVFGGSRGAWAGAIWMPGAGAFKPTDLSSKRGFSFVARGDGKQYAAMIFTAARGFAPSVQLFQPTREFTPVNFTWSQFDAIDGRDVTAIFIGQSAVAGPFTLAIDDVTLE